MSSRKYAIKNGGKIMWNGAGLIIKNGGENVKSEGELYNLI